jgi:DNA-binding CsgD family transcriptional regulator
VKTAGFGVVAREHELALIDDFVGSISNGGGSLVVQGPAGIGKTVLFDAGVAAAGHVGIRVLSARPAEAESALPYAGLGDLLAPVYGEVSAKLAAPLRRALDVALLQETAPAGGQDRLAVAVAVRDSLLVLADSGPTLLAIDDVQWLDPESVFALGYALRRTAGERLGVLAAARVEADLPPVGVEPLLMAPAERLSVTPLDGHALAALIFARLGTTYLPHTLDRIHAAAAGNPFHALEIAHALQARGGPPPLDEPLPVPLTLRKLMVDRLGTLSPSARRTLLAAAALSRPTVSVLRVAFGDSVDDELVEAQRERIAMTHGDLVAFAHPLFAGAAYDAASARERRSVHGQLAAVLSDQFEHARHLALSRAAPDEAVASLVTAAAEAAAQHGAVSVAATLAHEAVRLTADTDIRGLASRVILAADMLALAGATNRSVDELARLLEQPIDDATRVRALYRLTYRLGNDLTAAAPLVDEIVRLAAGLDDAGATEAQLQAAAFLLFRSVPDAISRARQALERASRADDPDLVVRAQHDLAVYQLIMGSTEYPAAIAAAQAASADRPHVLDVFERTSLPGWQALWSDRITDARSIFTAAARSAEASGAYGQLLRALMHLTEADIRAGDLTAALDHAERATDLTLGDVGEQPWSPFLVGYSLAYLGRSADARRLLVCGVEMSREYGDSIFLAQNLAALGFLEVSTGNFPSAVDIYRDLRHVIEQVGLCHPAIYRWQGDAMEALVATGDLDAANEVRVQLAESATALDLPGCLALAARGEGLIAAARGQFDQAVDVFTHAVALHDLIEAPVDRARTKMLLGATYRRLHQKSAARSALQEAATALDAMGVALWSARAGEELARIGGRVARPLELSPTETQVARLAATGRTNREVAAELFISVKTVEANLSSIYRKLNVRSRTELARLAAADTSREHPAGASRMGPPRDDARAD